MGKATLVIMAAGIGSRFGGGIKQLEAVGPNGEIIMDYSIYDAMKAGFDKVVFVIRKDLEKDFKEVIGHRIEKKIEVEYAFQEVDDIPQKYKEKFKNRKKPWGTGQAVLCCKDVIKEPFLVINADDYYGKDAYKKAYQYLSRQEDVQACMVGFLLGNTLSENGGVTRGICTVDETGKLLAIEETHNIEKVQNIAVIKKENDVQKLDINSEVSMNMWGLSQKFLEELNKYFEEFLDDIEEEDQKTEYLLPEIVNTLLKKDQLEVVVLRSNQKWFGVTYKEDKKVVVTMIRELVAEGGYIGL